MIYEETQIPRNKWKQPLKNTKLIIKSQINHKPTFKLQRKQSVVLLYFCISVLIAKRQEIDLKGGNDQLHGLFQDVAKQAQ